MQRQTKSPDHGASSRWSIPPALRYPAYRAYWLGMLASVSGFQMFRVGQLWLIYQLTGSPWSLGYLGLANAVPGIVFNLFGGVFADKLDKRRLIMTTQAITAGLIFLLATLTLLDLVKPWHILTIAFLTGAVEAFDTPARQAIYPHLIDRKVMMSAVALNSAVWQGNRIVAPAVAGFIIDLVSTEAVFYLSGVGFLALAAVMYRLPVPKIASGSHGSPAQEMVEGLNFIRKNSVFSFLIGMTFFNSFFGAAYIMLMPIFAVDVLEVGARGQGLLLGIGGVGALLTTLWLSTRGDIRHRGLLIVGGGAMFGLALAAFALTSRFVGSFPLALAIMLIMGIFQSTYMISIQSSLQMLVPDQLRGRVMGFYGITWSIMPLGGLQAGALASFITAPFAVAIGGLAVTAFALGPALVNPKVRRLDDALRQTDATAPRSQGRLPSQVSGDG